MESIIQIYLPQWKDTHSRLLEEVQSKRAGRKEWLWEGDRSIRHLMLDCAVIRLFLRPSAWARSMASSGTLWQTGVNARCVNPGLAWAPKAWCKDLWASGVNTVGLLTSFKALNSGNRGQVMSLWGGLSCWSVRENRGKTLWFVVGHIWSKLSRSPPPHV